MSIRLDPTERRIIGSLVEKQQTVPEAYPLTLNSLVLACNQKSNRDPEMELRDYHVQGALRALMDRGWVRELERAGSRTVRYEHAAGEQLGVDEKELAILAELLLRGPSSAKEIETRASRMRPLGTVEEVESRLRGMATRPVPYVHLLGRRPGERVPRWEHLLGSEPAVAVDATAGSASDVEPAVGPSAPVAVARSSPPSLGVAGAVIAADVLGTILARLDRLEREVSELRSSLGGA